MRFGLRAQLILPIVAVVMLSMGVAGFISTRNAADELWIELEGAARNLSTNVASSLTDFTATMKAITETQAEDKNLAAALAYGTPDDMARAVDILKRAQRMSPAIHAVNLLNASGDTLLSSDPRASGNFSDRAYFKKAIQGEVNISEPLMSRVTNKPVFVVAAPVRHNTKILGILYLRVDMAEFSRTRVESVRIGQAGYAYLINTTGIVVAHPNPDYVLQFDISQFDWFKTLMSKDSGTVNYTHEGVSKAAMFAREPVTGWTVVITVNHDDLQRATKSLWTTAFISMGAGVLLVCAVIFWIVRRMTGDLQSCVHFAEAVAGGDLNKHLAIRRTDEIGQLAGALEVMVTNLQNMIATTQEKSEQAAKQARIAEQATTQTREAMTKAEQARKEAMNDAATQLEGVVEVLSSASTEISAQIEQSSNGAQEQADRVQETATAMEEMNATVLEVARSASSAADMAGQARTKAEDGSRVVALVVSDIEQVDAQSQRLKTDMHELGAQAEGIGYILNVISDIADQTNLLALNAAIEAARAGDAGRGFAVVADEVRKLAEKTMTATKEVDEAVRSIQAGTRTNVENVERAVQTIDDATIRARQAQESLTEIVHLVDQATDQVRSIATASEQQASASEEITRSVGDVRRISHETSEAMRESAQAVVELANQAGVLRSLVEELKNDEA